MIPAARDAATHLQTVIRHWPDLADALATRQNDTWPPTMGIARIIDAEDRELAAAERAAERSPDQLGVRPAPIRIHIVDTMRACEAALVHLADQIASTNQRPTLTAGTGRGWSDDLHRQAALLAAKDGADSRRWRYSGQRTAPRAALWLYDRLHAQPGPFQPLTDNQVQHIANVAAAAAERVERALGMARRTESLERPCPHCRGRLELHGADGQDPTVRCTTCGRTWTPGNTAPAA